MVVKDVLAFLDELAPRAYAEDFDNTGLLVGDPNDTVNGILVTLDTLEAVVDEAIENNCNLIVSFHPIIFSGLQKLTGKTYVERTVIKALKNNISIIAVHTALDNSWRGVNAKICDMLQLSKRSILIPQKETIKKLTVYVPVPAADTVRNAIFSAGGGTIGNYSNCSFNILGKGSFEGNADSNPRVGRRGETHFGEEMQLGITFPTHRESAVLEALFASHPYEEVAFEVHTLENKNQHIGMGMIGTLPEAMTGKTFVQHLKSALGTECIRHSQFIDRKIQKVAVLGGSGSFAIDAAISAGADAYVTADLKYHDFFRGEGKLVLCDVGHYESEQHTKALLRDALTKKFTNFAVVLSQTNTNPISYS
ncbi:MAG: Nif3-like dinuclear metal center hexameric protein [Flavobacteriaceae bacterium]|nr:Nif3-like dinuclear metal center hexameric protein [Flavobacteriaceae bacterium]